MKKIFFFIAVLWFSNLVSQNKQILYDFAELPQTLLLNPASETNYKLHVGVPLLSGFSTEFGSKGFTVSDLFADDNRSINDKVAEVLQNIDSRDYVKFNSQVEVFSAGYRFDDKTYFSIGFYEEIDAIGYFPKDILTLINEGNNAYLNKSFNISV